MLPSAGTIRWLEAPSGPGVRWDSGVVQGSEVTLHYDSMLAKLIVWGPTRREAIRTMQRALDELVVVGVATNVPFHQALLRDPDFVSGAVDIQFLERRPDLLEPPADDETVERLAIAAALLADERRQRRQVRVANGGGPPAGTAWRDAARREGLR